MKKLTLRNYLGYAAGDLANNLAFSLQALFLLIYYTNVVGLESSGNCDDVPGRTSVGCLR
jgi:glucuronide carrier protein